MYLKKYEIQMVFISFLQEKVQKLSIKLYEEQRRVKSKLVIIKYLEKENILPLYHKQCSACWTTYDAWNPCEAASWVMAYAISGYLKFT